MADETKPDDGGEIYMVECVKFGKRMPGLMSNELYMKNLNGYGICNNIHRKST